MPTFVYLEFSNRKVRDFLADLRDALAGRPSNRPMHITLRGPYARAPKSSFLAELQDRITGYGVVIGGAGYFEIADGYAVYLKAQSPLFKSVWWKRDYPKGQYGINPHVTLLETQSLKRAKQIVGFLRSEKIEISTFGLYVSLYASRQLKLFEVTSTMTDPLLERIPIERWKVKTGIVNRAALLSA